MLGAVLGAELAPVGVGTARDSRGGAVGSLVGAVDAAGRRRASHLRGAFKWRSSAGKA